MTQFKIQISGQPEEVGRLRFLAENSEMIPHVLGKLRAQKLDPQDNFMVFVALTDDNPLGATFMKATVDPDYVPLEDRDMYACTMTREHLKVFFDEHLKSGLPVAEADLPQGSTRMVILALDGATRMDAVFPTQDD